MQAFNTYAPGICMHLDFELIVELAEEKVGKRYTMEQRKSSSG
jgi:hypothetical protein